MRDSAVSTTIAGALALALSAAACDRVNQSAQSDLTSNTTGTAVLSSNFRPVSVVGCVQAGAGRNSIVLTDLNTTPKSVGTSGTETANGDAQLSPVAYRLSGDDANLRNMIGKRVRVRGRLALATGDRVMPTDKPPAAGLPATGNGKPIDETALGRVEVITVDRVSDVCAASGEPEEQPIPKR